MRTAEAFVQLADYILNHYDKTSEKDKVCLGKKLQQIQDEAIAHGMTLSAEIVSKHWNSQYDLVNQKAQASRSEQSILTARDNKVWRKE